MNVFLTKIRQETKCILDEVQYVYGMDGVPYEYFSDDEIDVLIWESLKTYSKNKRMIPFFAAYKLTSIFLNEFDSKPESKRMKSMWKDMMNIELIRLNHKRLFLLIENNPDFEQYCCKIIKK